MGLDAEGARARSGTPPASRVVISTWMSTTMEVRIRPRLRRSRTRPVSSAATTWPESLSSVQTNSLKLPGTTSVPVERSCSSTSVAGMRMRIRSGDVGRLEDRPAAACSSSNRAARAGPAGETSNRTRIQRGVGSVRSTDAAWAARRERRATPGSTPPYACRFESPSRPRGAIRRPVGDVPVQDGYRRAGNRTGSAGRIRPPRCRPRAVAGPRAEKSGLEMHIRRPRPGATGSPATLRPGHSRPGWRQTRGGRTSSNPGARRGLGLPARATHGPRKPRRRLAGQAERRLRLPPRRRRARGREAGLRPLSIRERVRPRGVSEPAAHGGRRRRDGDRPAPRPRRARRAT